MSKFVTPSKKSANAFKFPGVFALKSLIYCTICMLLSRDQTWLSEPTTIKFTKKLVLIELVVATFVVAAARLTCFYSSILDIYVGTLMYLTTLSFICLPLRVTKSPKSSYTNIMSGWSFFETSSGLVNLIWASIPFSFTDKKSQFTVSNF